MAVANLLFAILFLRLERLSVQQKHKLIKMDPALLKERELFKKRALSTPS